MEERVAIPRMLRSGTTFSGALRGTILRSITPCNASFAIRVWPTRCGAGRWLTAIPSTTASVLKPLRMQVALRRRLRLPLPLGPHRCNGRSCRHVIDALGDHWTSCMRSGRVRRRARVLERIWARVFREAGARVQENVFVRDMGLPGFASSDGRKLEIVATGLQLERGIPLAVDATLVSPLHCNEEPWPLCETRPGNAIARAEERKAATYPELVNTSIVKLTTLACEVGGRWSSSCRVLEEGLAAARAQSVPRHLQSSAQPDPCPFTSNRGLCCPVLSKIVLQQLWSMMPWLY